MTNPQFGKLFEDETARALALDSISKDIDMICESLTEERDIEIIAETFVEIFFPYLRAKSDGAIKQDHTQPADTPDSPASNHFTPYLDYFWNTVSSQAEYEFPEPQKYMLGQDENLPFVLINRLATTLANSGDAGLAELKEIYLAPIQTALHNKDYSSDSLDELMAGI